MITVLLLLVLAGSLLVKMRQEQGKMTPLETGEVIPGIFAINNGFVNHYLIQGDEGYLMIDAGNNPKQTSAGLAQLGISPEEIQTVLLTHSDGDHISTLSLFPNAAIYLPRDEVQMIDGTTTRAPMTNNTLNVAYQTLHSGDTVDIAGFSVECIATPGHTPGSMSFLVDGKYLFVGDSMSLQSGKADLFNSFYNMDDEVQRSSIQMLAQSYSMVDFIFTGHYGYTGDPDTAFGIN